MARPVSVYSRNLTGSPDASTSIRAQRQIQPGIASNGRTSARRRGRRVLIAVASRIERRVIIHPIRGGNLSVSKLTGFGLGNEYSSGIDQPLDWKSVFCPGRVQPVISTIAITGSNAGNIVDILDGSSYPCQWFFCCLRIIKPRRHSNARGVDPRNGGWKWII